ncbi:hypothetical protein BMAGN_5004 [Bifidobacterium magnum]|uniref:Antitoxin SocA-like Panacea domain-containing protein n=3 Tax=Bifidobacterium magnum TaxID=1692 RepID=A0A087B6B0_9BIFI|nr:type II toxin-antitoxin system antitoxin SocA domain-containing protein [Bifidobacterium magnum]KFI66560.1 hypothetical protein BMAGN_5004 [Bifidobacterium magnum]
MARIIDVAAYILKQRSTMTTMKLQKLTYYSQALYLSLYETPLFDENFEAWKNGPVAPELFNRHRGMFLIHDGELAGEPDITRLNGVEKTTIERICKYLGDLTGNELSERTHMEDPWKDARKGLSPYDSCNIVIPKQDICEYYKVNKIIV